MVPHALVALLAAAAAVEGSPPPPWLTGESRPEDLEIALVTMGPGDSLTEWWGHTAPVVRDRRLRHERLYNFGMFGSDDPVEFVTSFVKGRLMFWAADAPVGPTFALYRRLNRDVRVQELALSAAQAAALAKALATNVLPENKFYLYHHYDDNCSTRPRDLIDRALGGQLLAASAAPGRLSTRRHARRYAQVSPVMSVALDFLQNDELDRPSTLRQEAFLPDELERQLAALTVTQPDGTRRPLVSRQWSYFEASRPPVRPADDDYLPAEAAIGALLAAAALLLAHLAREGARAWRIAQGTFTSTFGLVLGVPGTVLFLMSYFTDHTVTFRNENLWLANPLTLAALPLGISLARGSARAGARLRWLFTALAAGTVCELVLKLAPAFDQDNWNLIALIAPVNLALAAAGWLQWRRARSTPTGRTG